MIEYYKRGLPAIVGSILGTTLMFLTFYFAWATIYGVK